jgi:uncharacterized protein YbjT (DUF2867 family)
MDFRLKSDNIILVLGATGNQGGAVASELVSTGWRVRALVRNPDKPFARSLAWKGIELVKGDLNDRATVEDALKGVHGVFCNLTWREGGVEAEIRQGKIVVDACRKAGIGHVVYSSVGGAERKTGIPHFDSKWQIEEYLRNSGLTATVLRPVYLMINFNAPDTRESVVRNGTLSMALKPDRTLQMLAVEDLAAFVSMAFDNPGEYAGKAIELAGDELTMPQVASVFSKWLGRPVRYVELPIEKIRSANKEAAIMFEWFNKEGYQADIKSLRALRPGLLTLESWLAIGTSWSKAA